MDELSGKEPNVKPQGAKQNVDFTYYGGQTDFYESLINDKRKIRSKLREVQALKIKLKD
jgi:hypothetical protein